MTNRPIQNSRALWLWSLAVLLAAVCIATAMGADDTDSKLQDSEDEADRVLAVVNGDAIRERDLRFFMLSRQLTGDIDPDARLRLIETLIDRRLIRQHLEDRRAEAADTQVQFRVSRIKQLIRKAGDDPNEVLGKLGYTDEMLRRELALPLGWSNYAARVVTADRVREYFAENREKFDGTELRARQILIRLPAEADADSEAAAKKKLDGLRAEIKAGVVAFAEAAQRHSDAPSGKRGGEVGDFRYRGSMPESFTRNVFDLPVGELSKPFRTPFGMHLVEVTERNPGELSLEDVRRDVLEELSEQLWDETVAELRSKASIRIAE